MESISRNRFLNLFFFPFCIGSLSVLSFAPFNYTFINFLIFPLLYLILLNIKKKSKSKFRKKPFLINCFLSGFFFGFGFFLFGNYWISNSLTFDDSFKILIPFSLILIPALLALFYGFATTISGYLINNTISSIFMFSSIFSIADYLRGKILTGFPWNLWSYSFHWFDELIQITNIIGIYAFNLLSIIIFVFPVSIILKKSSIFKLSFTYLLFVFSLYIYGNYVLNISKEEMTRNSKNSQLNFKIISPSFDITYGLNDEDVEKLIEKVIKFSEPKKSEKTIFVWPEGVFSGYYFRDLQKFKGMIQKNFSSNHIIVFGTNTFDEKLGKTYNSLIAIDKNFNKLYQYNKIRLVPFGEFLPAENILKKIGLKKITEGHGSFSRGSNFQNFLYDGYNILPAICYELIFPEIFQKSNKKTNIIINISEDGWFGDSIGPSQHFIKAKFRAIENNSFLIRSANKGYSAFLNNKGQVIKILDPNEPGNIELRIPALNNNFKNRNDLIFFTLLITYLVIFKRFRNE